MRAWVAAAVVLAGLPLSVLAAETAVLPEARETNVVGQSAQQNEAEPSAAEPDFTVVNLPTTLRLPVHRLAFRITHRFARGVKAGTFSDLAGDFFGLDGHAVVGLELRYGLLDRTQLGVQRINDRTIELFAQHELLRQGSAPFGLAALASVDGLDNFSEDYSPRLGALLSRTVADRWAIYAIPMWVRHVDPVTQPRGRESTFVVGLATRLMIFESTALTGEYAPRVAGFRAPGSSDVLVFGIEQTVGGHCFQLNLSNDLGTTPARLARGQQGPSDWYVGFNLSRKFF